MANFHVAQLDPFSLSGAGVVTGATSIILKSFQTIDGVNLVMADFGSYGYGTLDPGNGTLEEQISFSGITQNSNGTATLTGVKTVLMLTPYTETSGLAQTHAGSTPFVITNTSGFYNQFAIKVNDETIDGQWTFTNTPITPPTVSLASTTVAGIVQEATQAQVRARTQVGSTGAELFLNTKIMPNVLISDYVVDTGAANAYVITPVPAITAYVTGQVFSFKAVNANTAASTLAVNGLTAKTIKLQTGVDIPGGAIQAGGIVLVEYDGTNFQILSPSLNIDYQSFTTSGTWTKLAGLTGNELVIVQAIGGGGGGGSNSGTGDAAGGGGGGGSFVEVKFLASALTSTVAVTIPAASAAATAGGNVTFGAFLTAYGGGAGTTAGAGASGGGGGGGGALAAGSTGTSGSPGAGGAGGGPGGGAAGVSAGGLGGAGGGAGGAAVGGTAAGGGGGGGGNSGANDGGAGGAVIYGGGGGGGGGGPSGTGSAGGTSLVGGAGGAGGHGSNGVDGVAPGGGGGGSGGNTAAHTGGNGATGQIRVWTIRS